MIDVVFCGKNDRHGGISFEEKVILMLERNTRIFRKYDLEHTFWFVEWGEDPEKGWLSPELVKRFENCRCIMVPDNIVAKAQIPPVRFQEFTAKNIGISRATGTLVIATNSDILFSEALVRELKTSTPDDNVFYRAPRYDICCDTLPDNENEFRITTKYEPGINYCEAAGDFFAATPRAWEQICGYSESPSHLRHLDSEAVIRAMSIGLTPIVLPPVYHKEHPESTKFASEWRQEWGIQDDGLRIATKIMPRPPFWGHRHCRLRIPAERLYLLQPCDWEEFSPPVNSPQKELFDDLFRRLYNDAIILKVGSNNKNLTLAMGKACLGTRRKIYSMDTSSRQSGIMTTEDIGRNNRVQRPLEHVVSIRGSVNDLITDWDILSNGQIDFLLLDGDRSLEEIVHDFNTIFPLIRTGGWIALCSNATTTVGFLKSWEDVIRHGLKNHGNHGSIFYGQKTGPLPCWLGIFVKKLEYACGMAGAI